MVYRPRHGRPGGGSTSARQEAEQAGSSRCLHVGKLLHSNERAVLMVEPDIAWSLVRIGK